MRPGSVPASTLCETSEMKSLITSIAAPTSSRSTDSAGLWLMPLSQRTKSMAAGARAATCAASCPAPLESRFAGTPDFSTALSRSVLRSESMGTAGVSCRTRHRSSHPREAAISLAFASRLSRRRSRAGEGGDLTYRRDGAGLSSRGALHLEDELTRRAQRVPAGLHWHGPRVTCLAGEADPEAALAVDRRYHADRQVAILEHGSLLYVNL